MSRALRRVGPTVILRERVVTSGRKARTHDLFELLAPVGLLLRYGLSARRHRGPSVSLVRPPARRPALAVAAAFLLQRKSPAARARQRPFDSLRSLRVVPSEVEGRVFERRSASEDSPELRRDEERSESTRGALGWGPRRIE